LDKICANFREFHTSTDFVSKEKKGQAGGGDLTRPGPKSRC
jgi:hypothetical protein